MKVRKGLIILMIVFCSCNNKEKNPYLVTKTDSFKIPDSIVLFGEENKPINLIKLFKQGEKELIVLRYKEINCNICIDIEVKNVKKITNGKNDKRIVIFGSYTNNRYLSIFKRINELNNFMIYNTKFAKFGIKEDSLLVPYYFLLNKQKEISSIFIPDRNTPEITLKYLKSI